MTGARLRGGTRPGAPSRRSFLVGALAYGAASWSASNGPAGPRGERAHSLELAGESLLNRMQWLNPPALYGIASSRLTVTSRRRSDFWQRTRYGYSADSGNFLHLPVVGDFILECRVQGRYSAQYDQAGLMARFDAGHWLRCGLVLVGRVGYAVTVLTDGFSDWAAVPAVATQRPLWWRLVRTGEDFEVLYSTDGHAYTLIRVGHLPLPSRIEAGVMCASPEGPGFAATFDELRLAPQRL